MNARAGVHDGDTSSNTAVLRGNSIMLGPRNQEGASGTMLSTATVVTGSVSAGNHDVSKVEGGNDILESPGNGKVNEDTSSFGRNLSGRGLGSSAGRARKGRHNEIRGVLGVDKDRDKARAMVERGRGSRNRRGRWLLRSSSRPPVVPLNSDDTLEEEEGRAVDFAGGLTEGKGEKGNLPPIIPVFVVEYEKWRRYNALLEARGEVRW